MYRKIMNPLHRIFVGMGAVENLNKFKEEVSKSCAENAIEVSPSDNMFYQNIYKNMGVKPLYIPINGLDDKEVDEIYGNIESFHALLEQKQYEPLDKQAENFIRAKGFKEGDQTFGDMGFDNVVEEYYSILLKPASELDVERVMVNDVEM